MKKLPFRLINDQQRRDIAISSYYEDSYGTSFCLLRFTVTSDHQYEIPGATVFIYLSIFFLFGLAFIICSLVLLCLIYYMDCTAIYFLFFLAIVLDIFQSTLGYITYFQYFYCQSFLKIKQLFDAIKH